MADGVELATAYISIVPEGSRIAPEVKRQFGKVGVEADRAGKASGKRFGGAFGSSLKLLGGAAIGGGVLSFLKSANDEGREAQKVGALTANVIKQTGGAANVTAEAVGNLSTAISNKVGVDDEAIQSGANLLLTFKNVRNEIGKGNKIFDRATQAAVDLSSVPGFGDLAGSAKQLGKALNDPIKGISALSKAGVTFTDDQKKQIKTLVESGNVLKAQKIILKEVESQVGGSAEAQATASDKAAVSIGNLKEQIGTALLPTVDKLAKFTTSKLVPAISEFISDFEAGTGTAGDLRDVLEDTVTVGKGIIKFFDDLPGPVKKFGVQALIAYAALKKIQGITGPLNMGIANLSTNLSTSKGKLDAVGKAGFAMGGLLKQAAGAGGLVLFTKGVQEADDTTSTFYQTLGAAGAGFAIGGPVGAAAGAIAGFATSVATANETTHGAERFLGDYRTALDLTTGKLKETAEQIVLTQARASDNGGNLFKAAALAGISDKQIAQYIIGNKKVRAEVDKTLAIVGKVGVQVPLAAGGSVDAFSILTQTLNGSVRETADGIEKVGGLTQEYKKNAAEVKRNARQVLDLKNAFAGLPKNVVTKLTNANTLDLTLGGLEKIADKYKKTPKEVRTLVKASGLTPTNAEMKVLLDRSQTLKEFRARPKIDSSSVRAANQDVLALLNNLGLTKLGLPGISSSGGRDDSNSRVISPSALTSSEPRNADSSARRVVLQVGAQDMEAYVDYRAIGVVDSAAALRGETERAL